MRELHVLEGGEVRLRLGAYGLEEAHALVGDGGYPGLLYPFLGDAGDGALGVAVTPWVVCLHVPAPLVPSTFDGIAGGTTALFWAGALPAPATTDAALLVQAVAWLAACRRLPASLGPDTGPVGRARIAFGKALAALAAPTVVRIEPGA